MADKEKIIGVSGAPTTKEIETADMEVYEVFSNITREMELQSQAEMDVNVPTEPILATLHCHLEAQ